MLKAQTYEKMKDSGVEWLGEIPAHWNIKPGLTVFTENKESNKGMRESQVLSLSYGKIIIKPKEKLVGLVPESFETYQLVKPGDIIIRCTDLQNDKKSLRTGLAINKGIITSAYVNLRVKKGHYSKYWHYYLHSLDTTKVIYKFGSGLRQSLSFLDFKRLPVFNIPLPEQKAIANFLDRKTGQIDAAVAIKEKTCALLKERKQILIQNAVTQGLNPNAPKRDSGVEWIGDIPEHWEVKPGFTLFSENKRTNKGMIESQVLSLSYGNIIIKPLKKLIGLVPESFETYQIVEKGDIIVRCMDLQNDKTSLRTGLAKDKGIITSAYLNLNVATQQNSQYLHYYLHTIDTTKVIYKYGTGLRQNLSFFDFKRMPVLKIPLSEQIAIVAHIEKESAKIDQAIELQQQQIEKLKEYKTTLINSAVTGKIKVPLTLESAEDS